MWAANLKQIFKVNPEGEPFSAWVVFLRLAADTEQENALRESHEKIDSALTEQNVRYTEITTQAGRNEAYKKFGVRDRSHPLFLVLNKAPNDYVKDEQFIVVEWGKWKEIDELRSDVMRFANFFSDEEFVQEIAKAKEVSAWQRIVGFTKEQGIPALGVGASILGAIL